jgi:hypothetical protein
MPQKRSYQDIHSSPPTYTTRLIEDEVDEDEIEEDIGDAQLQLCKDLESFSVMKETIKKSSEGALATKTISDYKR